jgi:predicted PurR-regulated permease PerM
MIEKIRLALINWNIAPLFVVGFLCYLTSQLVNNLLSMTCDSDAAVYIALSGLVATMGGIIYKLYDSMQANRKV